MIQKSVILVATEADIFGAYHDALEDIQKYVADIFVDTYSDETREKILNLLKSNEHICTIITRGVWYNKLLATEYIQERPWIQVEQMVVDARVCMQELSQIYKLGYRRIGMISVSSEFGSDQPDNDNPMEFGDAVVQSCIIKNITDPCKQIQDFIDQFRPDVLWGDVSAMRENSVQIPMISFSVRGKILSSMLHHAAVYSKSREEQIRNEKFKNVFHTMVKIISEAVIIFDHTGVVIAANEHKIIAHWKKESKDASTIQGLINIPLDKILAFSANELINIGGQDFIVNLLQLESNNLQYALIVNSARKISDYDLSARAQMTQKKFPARYSFDDIIHEDPVSDEALKKAKIYAQNDGTILITGATGTGKELYASSIHRASLRKDHPFVAINCATFNETLIDSELFGYEKGSFTGALASGKRGLFELAHQGTIFLDEISEMPLHLQTKLLRVLQEQNIRRIGGNAVIPIDIRVIAATNKDLIEQCKKGLFRYDLYYRLALLELRLHPLCERPNDIIPLFKHFLRRNMSLTGRKLYWDDDDVFTQLLEYPWNGNIRELENVAMRTSLLTSRLRLTSDDIRRAMPEGSHEPQADLNAANKFTTDITNDLNILEREYVTYLMSLMQGNKDAVCNFLHISKPTLWRKITYGAKADKKS